MSKKEAAFHARRVGDEQNDVVPHLTEPHPTEAPGKASVQSSYAGPEPRPGRGPPLEIIRLPMVLRLTGLSRTSIWRKVRAGDFPAPVDLGPNAMGWFAGEIAGWLSDRPRRTYGAPTDGQPESAA